MNETKKLDGARGFKWTNASVIGFAGNLNPVEVMEQRARNLALQAMDDGWGGPPFDPLSLAEWLEIRVIARDDIADARLLPDQAGRFVLEYNPMRPRGRQRFSIAHEIAHTLFPDCSTEVRHRAKSLERGNTDNWQLEVLCNIGAAELLMPLGSFTQLSGEELSIQKVMDIRKAFDVSVEACLIRLIKLSRKPSAAFGASRHDNGKYRVDYVIPTSGWTPPIRVGQEIPERSVVVETNAIGFTSVGNEKWVGNVLLHVECVALAPYPGSVVPRVVGFLADAKDVAYSPPAIVELDGDALTPRGAGRKIIAHVVPDTTVTWGGGGFASQVRRRYPSVWAKFRSETVGQHRAPALGDVFVGEMDQSTSVAHLVAQHGIGGPGSLRLRYAALAQCLNKLREQALSADATVHMPRVGTGHGGANWDVVRELLTEELVDKGVRTTVYRWPT